MERPLIAPSTADWKVIEENFKHLVDTARQSGLTKGEIVAAFGKKCVETLATATEKGDQKGVQLGEKLFRKLATME